MNHSPQFNTFSLGKSEQDSSALSCTDISVHNCCRLDSTLPFSWLLNESQISHVSGSDWPSNKHFDPQLCYIMGKNGRPALSNTKGSAAAAFTDERSKLDLSLAVLFSEFCSQSVRTPQRLHISNTGWVYEVPRWTIHTSWVLAVHFPHSNQHWS